MLNSAANSINVYSCKTTYNSYWGNEHNNGQQIIETQQKIQTNYLSIQQSQQQFDVW